MLYPGISPISSTVPHLFFLICLAVMEGLTCLHETLSDKETVELYIANSSSVILAKFGWPEVVQAPRVSKIKPSRIDFIDPKSW